MFVRAALNAAAAAVAVADDDDGDDDELQTILVSVDYIRLYGGARDHLVFAISPVHRRQWNTVL